ncbi:MAG TPA: zf-HC2 domain-containing protein [Longimicrobiales bacterium]
MTMHPGEARLNDWLDGELDAVAAADVAAHVDACASCRAEADALRRVLHAAGALGDSIEPRRDLWHDIDSHIDTAGTFELGAWRARRRGALWAHRYELAAAATLLVMLASTGTFLLVRNATQAPVVAADERPLPETMTPVSLVSVPGQADYAAAIRKLDALLREREANMDPQTAAVVRRNMAIIDQAIREAQAALAADPANGGLNQAVSAAYKTKINLLRRAVELPART